MIRSAIAFVLGWRVVALLDYDGEVNFRLAQPTPFGYRCYRMSRTFKIGKCLLLDGGEIIGASYVKTWVFA